jgi:hypothetical protein
MNTLLHSLAYVFGAVAVVCIIVVLIIAAMPDPVIDTEREKP